MTEETRRVAVAERAARAGGVVARERFRGELAVETKANKNDVVTDADREAQQQVIATLHGEFPDEALVCEEEAGLPGAESVELRDAVPETERAWIVDPIDGTANYVRGMRFWATSVAAVVEARPVAAATYLPAERDVYTAGQDGATRNGDPVAVSDRTDPETFAVGLIGWWPTGRAERHTALFRGAAERFGDLRRLGCMQGVLALVADGGLDAAFMPERPHPWDAVAGVHLIRQAGGTATDVHGERWRHDSEGLVVSNGRAHDTVLELLERDATA